MKEGRGGGGERLEFFKVFSPVQNSVIWLILRWEKRRNRNNLSNLSQISYSLLNYELTILPLWSKILVDFFDWMEIYKEKRVLIKVVKYLSVCSYWGFRFDCLQGVSWSWKASSFNMSQIKWNRFFFSAQNSHHNNKEKSDQKRQLPFSTKIGTSETLNRARKGCRCTQGRSHWRESDI